MTVGRGVLQGDCLSPLLFNMCFNNFIQHIKAEKYRQFGFSFKLLNPIHWLQFADDAAVITGQESENQHLLNRFSIWCQWSDMIIRVDKCSTFGIKKAVTKSVQYLPKLLISNQLIPKITIGESFQYLGRYFDFHMSNDNHKTELVTLLNELMSDVDSKPLQPKNKLLLYSRYVLSKLAWHLTVATLSKTWVTENIDSIANKYIRRWLEVPISGTLSTVFLTNNKFGLSIYPPSVKFIQCQTVLRKALKSSPNESTNDLWRATSNHTNIQYDAYNSTKEVLKDFRSGHENKLLNQLTSQGSFFCSVTKFALPQLSKLQTVDGSTLYADLNGFKSPSILTGDTHRPDLLLSCSNGSLYVVELTTGYETNLKNNVKRKKDKYRELLRQLGKNFNQVKFINLSISSLGIFAEECYTFLDMLDSIGLDKNHQMYCVRKMMTIAIRTTYYIFCCRNKEWENPDLLTI
ncbi:Hypothetical predicted protein [Paramuricea clavata]|uniref:Uncharacterized protein n=1 Tax=Paramuricea clavata TaxID=317549 RepID=A0A7D9E6B7_PARCT|nr:Hypothetical predicted protein [Paramuricea clavata]